MKILYVIGFFYPSQAGGPSSAISWLVKFVRKQGVDTKVVTTHFDIGDNIPADIWINNEFGEVCYHSYYSAKMPIRMIFSALRQIPRVDIVHLNSVFYPPSLIIAFFALIYKKIIFWDPGGELADECLKYGKLKKHLYLKLFRLIVRDKPYYHTTSARESNDVKSSICQNAKLFEVPNYIEDIEKIECDIKKQILFIGRLHPVKAVENLINAVALSAEFLNSDFVLTVAGNYDNNYGKDLLKLVASLHLQDKVTFIGHVTDTQKFRLYAESYCMILPSHSENFANVVTECLSQGTPVIASTGTPWKCLEDFKAGYHCSNEPSELAKAIDLILTLDIQTYLKIRANALDLLAQRFSMAKGVDNWIDAYRRALN